MLLLHRKISWVKCCLKILKRFRCATFRCSLLVYDATEKKMPGGGWRSRLWLAQRMKPNIWLAHVAKQNQSDPVEAAREDWCRFNVSAPLSILLYLLPLSTLYGSWFPPTKGLKVCCVTLRAVWWSKWWRLMTIFWQRRIIPQSRAAAYAPLTTQHLRWHTHKHV